MKYERLFRVLIFFALILSFFLGYLFALRKYELAYQEKMQKPQYIDVRTSKKSISLQEIPENIFLRVNGEIMQSGSIDLKE